MDKAESSRRNGAKSRGPLTPETKQISSRNSLKFGIYAKRSLALSTEDQAALDELRQNYYVECRPQDQRQLNLADMIVDSQWRHLRFSAMQNWLVEKAMHDMHDEVDAMFPGCDVPHDVRAALAYQHLYSKDSTLVSFRRECGRLDRTIQRNIRLFNELQELNPPPPLQEELAEERNCENEPTLPIGNEQKCGNEPTLQTRPTQKHENEPTPNLERVA